EQRGTEKETNEFILLSANDVRDAYDKVAQHMSKVGLGYVIPSVAYQKITEVFPLDEVGGSNPLPSSVEAPPHHTQTQPTSGSEVIDESTGEVLV
ncbi:MAG: DUF4494 family protein, partial [Flavobacteriales bacterium]|nr:DUF4494 family protein [Flavobacteriales bacterium]